MSTIQDRIKSAKKGEGNVVSGGEMTPFKNWVEGEENYLIVVCQDKKKRFGKGKAKQKAIRFLDEKENETISTSHVIVSAFENGSLKVGELYSIVNTETKDGENGFAYKDFEITHYPQE